MATTELDKMEQRCTQYAIEHITGKGLHTGERWLKDEFNTYCEAAAARQCSGRHSPTRAKS